MSIYGVNGKELVHRCIFTTNSYDLSNLSPLLVGFDEGEEDVQGLDQIAKKLAV